MRWKQAKRGLEALQEIEELQTKVESLKAQIGALTQQKKDCEYTLSKIKQSQQQAQAQLNNIRSLADGYGVLEEIGYEFLTGESFSELEDKLANTEERLAILTKDGAIQYTREYAIDGSKTKGKKFQENYCKNLLLGLNSYAKQKIKFCNKDGLTRSIELVRKAYNKYNNQGKLLGVSISESYLNCLLDIMRLKVSIKVAKEEERAKLRKEKERLREQEKILAEIAKEKERLAKERRYMEATLAGEINEAKQEEIKAKLMELDKREADIDYREQNQRAGWLYIAHSKAMPDCRKVGVTRRLNPLVRLQELSSASVPYPFECEGLVFSDDVFELETNVHQYFDAKRVNGQNRHKEFFYVEKDEVIMALKNKFNCDVVFIDKEEENDD